MIDTARSKFAISGNGIGLMEASAESENETKKALRSKWEELKNENFSMLSDVEKKS
jgi:hypothetical protein